jgi:hypothetical protein
VPPWRLTDVPDAPYLPERRERVETREIRVVCDK